MIHKLLKKQGVGEKPLITWHCWACLLGQVPPKSTDRGFERVNTRVVLPTHPRKAVPGLPASTSQHQLLLLEYLSPSLEVFNNSGRWNKMTFNKSPPIQTIPC